MKKISIVIVLALTISFICNAAPNKKILISQVVDHPALNATRRGIIDGLAQQGFIDGSNLEIRFESAQANAVLAAQIANKFVQQDPDIVVAIGTMSAQSFAKHAANNKVKLIFTTITDPVSASLVPNLQQTNPNITGVSNFVALEPQIRLFRQLQPNLKHLGILYNPGEINSVSIVQQLELLCAQSNLVLVKQAVSKTAEIPQAAAKLAANCDAIFISNDNAVLSALQSVIKAANNKHIPVYVSDTDVVAAGAVAALGPNQYAIGLQTGNMLAKFLNGADLKTLKVEFPKQTDLFLNLVAAKKCGIIVSDKLQKVATKIIRD